MIFSSQLIRERPVDPAFPMDSAKNAFGLACYVHCSQCSRQSPAAPSVAQAVAVAMAQGWAVKIKDGYCLAGVISISYLRQSSDVWCARCAEEWLET
jgi:hypothetical protein